MWDSTPLLVACQYAHAAVAAHLLSLGADVTLVNEKHVSAVLLTALEGMPSVLTLLLATPRERVAPLLNLRGTVYNSFTDKNAALTPLLAACTNGHVECVGLLLDAFDASDRSKLLNESSHDTNAFVAAARHGHTAVVHLLLQHGAIASVVDADGNNALLLALASGFDGTAVALIGAAPATATATNAEKVSALHMAARMGCADTVELLLATPSLVGPLLNATNSKGESALLMAARKKHVRVVEALVRAGFAIRLQVESELKSA
ncbi:hypothetical protein DYB32_006395 [Aphanomyces invadans]|uniref:Uncharacterized protein n=1 Tax=Aphanomyces invadans TaxID=157072 RepID=A0A3R6Y6G2_9STRA|nr:hypothetical protein DYB32_006395 [Aphanomyces invadans]